MGTITKLRKFLHKFAPRELSPTRLLEKYATDTKKKGAALVTATANVSARKQVEGEILLSQQVDLLKSLTPTPALIAAMPKAVAPVTAAPKAAPRPNYVPYVAGAVGLAALVLIMRSRK